MSILKFIGGLIHILRPLRKAKEEIWIPPLAKDEIEEWPLIEDSIYERFPADKVKMLFPNLPRVKKNIDKYLPIVLEAMEDAGLGDTDMILMALATIRAETEGFEPISEYKSKYNTDPGKHPFNRYDYRSDLGNQGPPDGESYRGRGLIQLTGRDNYLKIGHRIGLGDDLVDHPENANEPHIAAAILADFLKRDEGRIRNALSKGDLKTARRLVNGGSHGLKIFQEVFKKGKKLFS